MFVVATVVVLLVEALVVVLLHVGVLLRLFFFLRQPRPLRRLFERRIIWPLTAASSTLGGVCPRGHEILCPDLGRPAAGRI